METQPQCYFASYGDTDAAPLILSTASLAPAAVLAVQQPLSRGVFPTAGVQGDAVVLPSIEQVQAALSCGQLEPITTAHMFFMHTVPSRVSMWRTLRRRVEHYVAGQWHHPELVLRMGGRYVVLTVYDSAEGVTLRLVDGRDEYRKTQNHWSSIRLNMSSAQLWRAVLHFETQLGKPFNTMGYYTNYVAPMRWFAGRGVDNERAWTCSQLMCAIMHTAEPRRFAALEPRTTTPTELYVVLNRDARSVINE